MHFREVDNRARSRVPGKLGLGASSLALMAALGMSSAAAQTQTAATNNGPIETVTVTAQYITQDVQQTPLSISVVTGQDLDMRGINNLGDLGTTIPGLTLTPAPSAFGNAVQTYIRGVGQYDTAFASEPGVGLYIDDVYFGTMSGSEMSLMDLNRVEVLKGPQGVLGGKNDIGGAIKMFTVQPSDDTDGYLEATYGAYNDINIKGATNLTVIPGHLFIRLTAMSKNQDGFLNIIDYACANPSTAGSLPVKTTNQNCVIGQEGGTDVAAGRIAIRAVVDAHLEDTFAVDVVRDNSELTPDVLYGVDPGCAQVGPGCPAVDTSGATGNFYYYKNGGIASVPRSQFLGTTYAGVATDIPLWNAIYNIPTYGIPYDQRFIPTNPFKYTYATFESAEGIDYNQGEEMHSWSATNVLDYDVFNWFHFKSITGYRSYTGAYSNDSDVSPMSFQLTTTYPTDREIQQEERFTGTLLNDKLEWTAGIFYYHRDNTATGPVILDADYETGEYYESTACTTNPACPSFLGPFYKSLVFEQNDRYRANDLSEYIHAIYHIWDNWEVFGGFRYSDEYKIYNFDHIMPVPGYPGSGFFRDAVNPACDEVLDAACPANVPLVNNKAATKRPDWRAGTDYHITDDLMAYFQFATGYRSGGFNSRPFDYLQLGSYGSEEMDNYEIGAKTQWFDNRLRLNVSLFDEEYNHVITPIAKIDALGLPWTDYTNLGSASNKGVELEINAAPVDNSLITINYSHLSYNINPVPGHAPGFVDGCNGQASCGGTVSAGTIPIGSSPILFPADTFNISGQYTFNTDSWGQFTPRLEWDWQSTIYQDANNNPFTEIPARGLLNGSVTWEAPQSGWQVQFLVTNLADKKYFLDMTDFAIFGEGTVEAQPGPPREWFITLKKTF